MRLSIFLASLALATTAVAKLPEKPPAHIPSGYAVETIKLPKGAVTALGICIKPDSTIAVATWEGQVWERKGETWTLFADDLMEPNGIYWDEAEQAYYVAQKPELTRLRDTDGDNVCDLYETVTDQFGWSGEYHEYHYGPVVDSLGRKYGSLNLAARGDFIVPDGKEQGIGGGNMAYTAPYRGWVYRSDRMGHFQPFASGFRSPCGIGMSPDDQLFVTDNQGDWVGTCWLAHVREGDFYGHPASLPARPDFTKEQVLAMTASDFDQIRTKPAVLFPRDQLSQSPGSPVWDTTDGKFGPFKDQIFIGDQSQSNLFRCDVELIDGDYQGWCVPFLTGFESGTVKMNFAPDGQLWTAQVGRGWRSQGGKRTALQIVSWDGKTAPLEIHSCSLTKEGFQLTFTKPLAKAPEVAIQNWNYEYWSTYGSDEINKATVPLSGATLSEDGLQLTVTTELTTDRVYSIALTGAEDKDGTALHNNTIYYTVNKLRPAKEPKAPRDRGFKLTGSGWNTNDGRRPQPHVITPPSVEECALPIPENATVLDQSQWTNPEWKFDADGVVPRSKGNNSTKESYANARIHLEFRLDPSDDPEWVGQLFGNSGIFLMSGYELQVMNSYQNDTCADGMCGAIWGQIPPRVNASRPPGEWQSYDILMKAPEFAEDGSLIAPLRATIFHNGTLIHNDVGLYGEVGKAYTKHGPRPLMIQDHKGTGVSFRNLWIVPDTDYDASLPGFRDLFGSGETLVAGTSSVKKYDRPPITVLNEGMVRDMDTNDDRIITAEEFVDYRKPQFDREDTNGDGFLDLDEFPHPNPFKGGDLDNNGKLNRDEHLEIFRSQFPNVDVNRDGVITSDDKR